MAFEDEYRAYRSVIASGIQVLRPDAEVAVATLDDLDEELARFGPQVVVCDRPGYERLDADGGLGMGWVEIPVDPAGPAKASVGGESWESAGSALELLMEVVEKAERLSRANGTSEAR